MSTEMHQNSVHVGIFEEFELLAGEGLELTTELDLPESLFGTELAGQPLQLTINSLRPVDVAVGGTSVFADGLPVVASGPALIDLVASIVPGHNGKLSLTVLPSPTPLAGEWGRTSLTVHLTTPALRERWRALDLALARFTLAQEFAETKAQRESLGYAASLLPVELNTLESATLLRALLDATSNFAWLADELSRYRIHCIGHSHIDLAWLWSYEDTREVIARDMRSVLALFDDYPEFRFTHSQARSYAEVEASHPEMFARLVERIHEGRLEPATMQWVEADANLPSGEAHVRQLIEGVSYTREKLGVTPRVFFAPDAFGHSGNLPQLAVQTGAKVYYHHRANPGFAAGKEYWQAYWWVGDDGSKILGVATPSYLGPITATRLAESVITLGKRNGVTELCYFYGVGDHGGGPTRSDLDYLRQLSATSAFPSVMCSTVSEYADALLATNPELPEFHGESERVFEGCYTSHADAKASNRLAENALVSAESLAALAGIDAREEIASSWREVLHHQFHDILGGSAVAEAYEAQARDVGRALMVADDLSSRALAVLHSDLPERSLAVTNPLGHEVRDLAVVSPAELDGSRGVVDIGGSVQASQRTTDGGLAFCADLGPFETRSYTLINEPYAAGSSFHTKVSTAWDGVKTLEVSTPFYRARILPEAGIVTSLVDVETGDQLVGRGALSPESRRQLRPDLGLGALVFTRELPHSMSSWVEDDTTLERVLLAGGTTKIVENGPLRLVIESLHNHDNFDAVVRTTWYNNFRWIDFQVDLDWRERGSELSGVPGLALSFGARTRATELWAETPFSAALREPDGYRSPMLRWADIGSDEGGLAVANDSKYGVDALGPRMRVPLVRSTYDPDPVSDVGRIYSSKFRVLPHRGSWRDSQVVTMASGFNVPIISSRVGRSEIEQPVRSVPPPRLREQTSVVISSLHLSPQGVGVRMYESTGRTGEARLSGLVPDSEVQELTVLGDEVGVLRADTRGELALIFRGFEVRTFTVKTC